jgi:hypothetical protein
MLGGRAVDVLGDRVRQVRRKEHSAVVHQMRRVQQRPRLRMLGVKEVNARGDRVRRVDHKGHSALLLLLLPRVDRRRWVLLRRSRAMYTRRLMGTMLAR